MERVEPTPVNPLTPRRQARRLRRGGFTLLEILVVVGVILLLVAIGVIGFGVLDQSPKVTKTALNNLQSMLAEYQSMTDLREQPEFVYRGTTTQAPTKAPTLANLWMDPVEIGTATETNGDVNSGQQARYRWAAVANTQIVYRFLNRVPSNKQNVTRFPSKQVLGTVADTDRGVLTGATGTIDPPLILDAWNNPIIFVGSGGLAGVTLGSDVQVQSGGTVAAGQALRVTSVGLFKLDGDPFITTALPRTRRPFFASAGPDGDFTTGEDNVYSFDAQ